MIIGSLGSAKSVKPNGNWKLKKFKKIAKPNWMEDVEGVNCLLKKWRGVR